MVNERMKWLMISQSIALFGAGIVFPFYIIFINEIGANFSQFGMAFGLFTISAALVHKYIGDLSDRIGRKIFLLISNWGMAFLFLLFPIVTEIWQIYFLQIILGVFGAMQKTGEKAIVGDFTDNEKRGGLIGRYHAWIAVFSGFAVILGGYIIDFLTLSAIFYAGSIVLFAAGLSNLKIKEKKSYPSSLTPCSVKKN